MYTFAHPLIRCKSQCTWEHGNLWHKKWICDVFTEQIKFITTDTWTPHSLFENASGVATLCIVYIPTYACTHVLARLPCKQVYETPKQSSPNSVHPCTHSQPHSEGIQCTIYSSFLEVSFNMAFEWKWKIMSWRARNWKERATRHRARSCPHNKCTCLSGEKKAWQNWKLNM